MPEPSVVVDAAGSGDANDDKREVDEGGDDGDVLSLSGSILALSEEVLSIFERCGGGSD